MKKLLTVVLGLAVFVGISMTSANAKTLKCQTVLNTKADEVKMLKDFTDTVTELTDGSLKFEIMPAGTVVGVKETLDAVDKGLIDCGFRMDTLLVWRSPSCHVIWFASSRWWSRYR